MLEKLRSDYDQGKKSLVGWTLTAIVLCAVGFLGSIFTSLPVSFIFFLLGLAGCIATLISIGTVDFLYALRKRVILWEEVSNAPVGSDLAKEYFAYLDVCKKLEEHEEVIRLRTIIKESLICEIEKEAKKQNTP